MPSRQLDWWQGRPAVRDTTPQAAEIQARIQDQLGGAARLRLAYEMSAAARALAFAGLRARHPDSSPEELALALHPGVR